MARARGALDAETYAARQYRDGVRSFRRSNWVLLELVFGLPALAAIGWGLTLGEPTGFIAGFLAGALAVAWMTVRGEVPGYLQTWRQGAEGEWQTHKEIAALGWQVIEDVDTGHGNYDHIVVAPAGVYLLESKKLTGTVEVRGAKVSLRRRHLRRPTSLGKVSSQVRGASADISEYIGRRCGHKPWVQGVVVLWSRIPAEDRRGRPDHISEWSRASALASLAARPTRLLSRGEHRRGPHNAQDRGRRACCRRFLTAQ